jgi:hypothetical protein
MEGLDVGTLYATLTLTDNLSPTLEAAAQEVEDFSATTQTAAGSQSALSSALTTTANATSAIDNAATVAAGSVGTLSTKTVAADAAMVGMTATTAKAVTGQSMFAELLAEANAKLDAQDAAIAAATRSTGLWTVALEATAYTLGTIMLAVVAFGPRIYELIGGWEGLKKAGSEVASVFSDLVEVLEGPVLHVLDSVLTGLHATAMVLPTLGGYVVDFIVALGQLPGVSHVLSGIADGFGFIRDGLHALAGDPSFQDLHGQLEDMIPDEFKSPTGLTFGIDPSNLQAVATVISDINKEIADSNPWGMTFDQMSKMPGVIEATEQEYASLGIVTDAVRKATEAAKREQEAYNREIANLVDQFSGEGVLDKAKQYELVLGKIGGATSLTIEEQIKFANVFQAVIDKYSEMGPKGDAVEQHFRDLAATLVTGTSALNTELLFEPYMLGAAEAAAATEDMILGLDELANSGPRSALSLDNIFTPYTINAKEAHDAGIEMLTGLQALGSVGAMYLNNIAIGFLQLGQIIPGTTGSVMNFIGNALNGFNTLTTAIKSIPGSISQISQGFGQLSGGGGVLSGISGIMSGIGGIAGAAGAAIQVVAALGAALKNAFTSDITEFINPNRDLFFAQFQGEHVDPFTALGEAMITAAMQVYGVDRATAWEQYADPLMKQIYNADTIGAFKGAEMAIGELFRKAGVTIDIYNEAGIAQQYRSNIFDQGPSYSSGFVLPNSADQIAQYGADFATTVGTQVGGAYTGAPYGGTTFQSGSMPTMGGGGPCFYIENVYVNGSTGQEQAKSFFDAIYGYVAGGGDGMTKWRELTCAAVA